MSVKSSAKTNHFYFVVIVTMVAMAVLVIYVFRDIFSSITKAYEIDIVVSDNELRINRDNLEEAYKISFEKDVAPLDLK